MKLIHIVLLLLLFGGCNNSFAQKKNSDWLFIYWMPYDNNLSNWADSIVHMIDQSMTGDKITILIQADMAGEGGMKRIEITNGGLTEVSLDEEDARSGAVYTDYLAWVSDNYSSENYALTFLDHGGKLDEVGLDEYPQEGFLRIDSIRMAIENFNEKTEKVPELLFLQVCSKGSIEALYELRNSAKYTLFSQTILGAPNFYYSQFFDLLSNQSKDWSGLELSQHIATFEREDMYNSYVCIDNSKFEAFDILFSKTLQSINREKVEFDTNKLLMLFYADEIYWDLQSFLKATKPGSPELQSFLTNQLVLMNKLNPKSDEMKEYSGVSLLGMTKEYLDKMRGYNHLQFFQNFDMELFYNKLITK